VHEIQISSKYAHIYMECVLYIVVCLTMLDPISLGAKMYLNDVLGTLEMQWRLVSSIRKVLSPYENWSQARMIDELLSTTSSHCYLGNKYLIHAFSYSIQPLVGCILAWNYLFQKYCGSWKLIFKVKLFIVHLSNLRRCICWEYIYIMFMIHLPKYAL
jgi:hypothetical protein